MSELEQWCEIDGHDWLIRYVDYGLVLCPARSIQIRQCRFCHTSTVLHFIPVDEKPIVPIFGPILWW